jgi:hypothetical protein
VRHDKILFTSQELHVGSDPNLSSQTVKVLGYCDFSIQVLEDYFRQKNYKRIQDMDGEYTIICEEMGITTIVTSYIGAIQYFYYYDGSRFAHGSSIIKIAAALNLNWIWDWEALGDLCELENLTQNRTLHRHIKKVPSGSILTYDGTLKLRTIKILDQFKISEADPNDAINILNQQTLKWSSTNPFISLSGGFDSRLILSSMLKQEIFPTVVTVGNDDNSDMQVAEMISKRYLLEQVKVNLDVQDLIDNGEYIASLTNGAKPSCHWHTFLYPQKAKINKNQSFFVGTLGEFARSYYFDKGFLALLNDSFSELAQIRFWVMKLLRHRTFYDDELHLLRKELNLQINSDGVKKRAKRNANLAFGEFLSGGTRYYLEQRVPNFYANGISMYNSHSSWRSPFHNTKWLEKVWNLSDHWKLGSNWHRLAIYRNFPELLDFPEEKGFLKNRMLRKAPPLYWLPIMQKNKYRSYDLSTHWFTDGLIHQFILDNASLISDLVDKQLISSILDQHLLYKNRTRAISFILTILFFKTSFNREGI